MTGLGDLVSETSSSARPGGDGSSRGSRAGLLTLFLLWCPFTPLLRLLFLLPSPSSDRLFKVPLGVACPDAALSLWSGFGSPLSLSVEFANWAILWRMLLSRLGMTLKNFPRKADALRWRLQLAKGSAFQGTSALCSIGNLTLFNNKTPTTLTIHTATKQRAVEYSYILTFDANDSCFAYLNTLSNPPWRRHRTTTSPRSHHPIPLTHHSHNHQSAANPICPRLRPQSSAARHLCSPPALHPPILSAKPPSRLRAPQTRQHAIRAHPAWTPLVSSLASPARRRNAGAKQKARQMTIPALLGKRPSRRFRERAEEDEGAQVAKQAPRMRMKKVERRRSLWWLGQMKRRERRTSIRPCCLTLWTLISS